MTAVDIQRGNGAVYEIDQVAVLKALNLNPSDPKTQALLLVCERYNLDPVLRHIILIQGTPYVTRDGYLHVAHRSGVLDGIEVLDQGETDTHWWAKVAVYRKDMTRPFAYVGRYPKNGSNKQYGAEMAITRAEVMTLRRAFSVTGIAAADEQFDPYDQAATTVTVTATEQPALPAGSQQTVRTPPGRPNMEAVPAETRQALLDTIEGLTDKQQTALKAWAKERKIPNIKGPTLTPEHVETLHALIDAASDIGAETEPAGESKPVSETPEGLPF